LGNRNNDSANIAKNRAIRHLNFISKTKTVAQATTVITIVITTETATKPNRVQARISPDPLVDTEAEGKAVVDLTTTTVTEVVTTIIVEDNSHEDEVEVEAEDTEGVAGIIKTDEMVRIITKTDKMQLRRLRVITKTRTYKICLYQRSGRC